MKNLIIVGAGGMGREVLQWIKDINKENQVWNVLGFLDDNKQALDGKLCDYGVIGTIKDWHVGSDECYALAVASPAAKEKVVKLLEEKGANFVSLIHPRARIGEFNNIGKGVIVYPDASLSVNITIGNYVTLLGSTIGHDAEIGDYTSIMGACNINGFVKIGKSVFLGCQTVVVPGRKVGDNVFTSTGSVVMTNIKPGIKVMGNPAKKFEL